MRDTEVIVMLDGNLPIQRRGMAVWKSATPFRSTVWVCGGDMRPRKYASYS